MPSPLLSDWGAARRGEVRTGEVEGASLRPPSPHSPSCPLKSSSGYGGGSGRLPNPLHPKSSCGYGGGGGRGFEPACICAGCGAVDWWARSEPTSTKSPPQESLA